MSKKKRQQRKQAAIAARNAAARPPVPRQSPPPTPSRPVPPSPPAVPSAETSKRTTFLEKAKVNSWKAWDYFVEKTVDVAVMSGYAWGPVCTFIRRLNFVTYHLLILVSQLWLSMSLLYFGLVNLQKIGLRFHFPLAEYQQFLEQARGHLAWPFRLLVLACVGIASFDGLLIPEHVRQPLLHMKVLWNLTFAQIIMYTFIPFQEKLGDFVNAGLLICTMLRLGVGFVNVPVEVAIESLRFLPSAPKYHFIFMSLMYFGLTSYESEKFFDQFVAKKIARTQVE